MTEKKFNYPASPADVGRIQSKLARCARKDNSARVIRTRVNEREQMNALREVRS